MTQFTFKQLHDFLGTLTEAQLAMPVRVFPNYANSSEATQKKDVRLIERVEIVSGIVDLPDDVKDFTNLDYSAITTNDVPVLFSLLMDGSKQEFPTPTKEMLDEAGIKLPEDAERALLNK